VNYRGWKPLSRCLDALNCLREVAFTSQIVVVDNASGDGKLADFKKKYTHVNFIENTGNNGFSNGNNVGAQHASGEYLLFLNPDTSASSEPLNEMLQTAEQHPEYTIISCRQENDAGQDDKACGLFLKPITISGLTRALYRALNKKELDRIRCNGDRTLFPDWISGSLVLIKKDNFQKLGGWNEDYWIYYEDSDLCLKAWQSGGKVAYLCSVKLLHNHGGVTRRNYKAKAFYKTEVIISRHVYIRNHFQGFTRFWMQSYLVVVGREIPDSDSHARDVPGRLPREQSAAQTLPVAAASNNLHLPTEAGLRRTRRWPDARLDGPPGCRNRRLAESGR